MMIMMIIITSLKADLRTCEGPAGCANMLCLSLPHQSGNALHMDADSATHSAASAAAAAAEEEEPLFSNLDLFLFSLIIGIVVYWFMSRKKPEPIPEFKKLDTP